MASNIIQGTLGNPDWTYLGANPLVTATDINAYEPYNALTYMLTYDEIVKYYNLNSVDRMLYDKSLYGNTNELQKQVTFYKCAFYHERDLFNNSIKQYHLYYNKNGEIVNGIVNIDGNNYYPFRTIYPTSATAFTSHPGPSLVVRDVGSNYGQNEGWYCGKIPVFMDLGIERADKVLVIGTPRYRIKCYEPASGVAFEECIIRASICQNIGTKKFITCLKEGTFKTAFPM